eukprot:IDg12533t1
MPPSDSVRRGAFSHILLAELGNHSQHIRLIPTLHTAHFAIASSPPASPCTYCPRFTPLPDRCSCLRTFAHPRPTSSISVRATRQHTQAATNTLTRARAHSTCNARFHARAAAGSARAHSGSGATPATERGIPHSVVMAD